MTVLPPRPGLLHRARTRLARLEQRLLPERWARRIVTAFLLLGAAGQLIGMGAAVLIFLHAGSWQEQLDEAVAGTELDPTLLGVAVVIQLASTFVGFALFATAAVSWFRGRRLRAIRIVVVRAVHLALAAARRAARRRQFAVLQQSVFDLLLLGLVLRTGALPPGTPVTPRFDDEPTDSSTSAPSGRAVAGVTRE